jgi:hypothetical protein
MIDIDSISGGDVSFKNKSALKVKNLLKPLGTYPYFEKVGFDLEFWIVKPTLFSIKSFQTYLSQFLESYDVPLASLKVWQSVDAIATLFIEIQTSTTKE